MPKSVISCQTQTGPLRSAFWRISVRRFGENHIHATSFLKPQRCNGQFHSHHPIKLSHARQREDYGAEPFHTEIFTPGDCPRAIVHPPVGAPHGPRLKSLCVLGVLRMRHLPHAESAEHAEAVSRTIVSQRPSGSIGTDPWTTGGGQTPAAETNPGRRDYGVGPVPNHSLAGVVMVFPHHFIPSTDTSPLLTIFNLNRSCPSAKDTVKPEQISYILRQ